MYGTAGINHFFNFDQVDFASVAKKVAFFMLACLIATVLLMFAQNLFAATNNGAALQNTFTLLSDLSGGYGKQIIVVVGFTAGMIALVSLRGFAPMLGYIGLVIFAGTGLALGTGVSGAVI